MSLADIGIEDGCIADTEVAIEGGESLSEVHERVARWADASLLPIRTRDVVVVAHGGCIRVLRAHLSGTPLLGMAWGEVPNGCVIDATPSESPLSASSH